MFDLKVLIVSLFVPLIVGMGLNIFLRSRDHTSVSEAIVLVVYVQHIVVAAAIGYVAGLLRIDIGKYSSSGQGGFFPIPAFLPLMAFIFLLNYLVFTAAVYFVILQFAPRGN